MILNLVAQMAHAGPRRAWCLLASHDRAARQTGVAQGKVDVEGMVMREHIIIMRRVAMIWLEKRHDATLHLKASLIIGERLS